MALKPFVVERFGPLNLAGDPEEVGVYGCVDMLDVDLDSQGRARCRDGYAKYTASALAGAVQSIAAIAPLGGAGDVLAWAAGQYYAIDETGTVIDSDNPGANTVPAMFLPRGAISLATTSVSGHLMAYNGLSGTWADTNISGSVANADTWRVISQTPVSNRVVLTGGLSFYDRVVFSDANATPTWTATNWVDVGKEDGDLTIAAAVFRELLLVFKRNKFFVFYGESIDADGDPIFNYRTVNAGIGCAARFATATAPEGVYFLAADGVYVTSGDTPRKVSGALDPLFRGDLNPTYTGSAINIDSIGVSAMTYLRGRLYVAVPTGASTTNDRLLVLDTATGFWMVWSIAANCLTSWRPLVSFAFQREEILFGFTSGSNDIGRHARAYTTDNGNAIAWQHSSGLYDPSGENRTTVTLESSLWGSGSVTLKVANDHGAFDTGSAVTLGTSPAVTQGWQSIDREGVFWQHKISGSGPAVVHRLEHAVTFVKPAGIA